MILGIDFSIKSTAAALLAGGTYTFYTFARTDVIKEDVSLALRAAGVVVHSIPSEPVLPKKASIAERERSSLQDASALIPGITQWFRYLDIKAYGIEGFSFASTGNRLAQISGYQWVLRWEMLKAGIPPERFWIFSPMTVKATAGKGNYNKDEMIAAFLASDDLALQQSGLWSALTHHPGLFQNKKGGWLKPVDDLIDAYFVLKTTEKTFTLTENIKDKSDG